jgi:hypothetical protein
MKKLFLLTVGDAQGEHLRKVGALWRGMSKADRAKWRADGEFGSRVPGSSTFFSPKTPSRPSPYQMFVKGMTAQVGDVGL